MKRPEFELQEPTRLKTVASSRTQCDRESRKRERARHTHTLAPYGTRRKERVREPRRRKIQLNSIQ
eukprot:scaffold237658_cov60-Attheya_sp.AAC.2